MSPRKYVQRTRRVGTANLYRAMHNKVREARGLASEYRCVDCGGPATDWALVAEPRGNLTCSPNESGRAAWWSDDVWDYEAKDRKCHLRGDWARRRAERQDW